MTKVDQYKEVVSSFSKKMVERLEGNSDKGDRENWKAESYEYLLERLDEEVKELVDIIHQCKLCCYGKHRVSSEAADISNFAMMIADKIGGLKESKENEH